MNSDKIKTDNDTKKVTTNPIVEYNTTTLNQCVQPKIQILEPPAVYKPTPKSLLASSSTYSPPVKKPKLEYVPKSKSKCTSIATYVPSTSIKSNNDNDCDVSKAGWDYLSEIIDTQSSSNVTPTYVPTKIRRSTSDDSVTTTENNAKSTEDDNSTSDDKSVTKPADGDSARKSIEENDIENIAECEIVAKLTEEKSESKSSPKDDTERRSSKSKTEKSRSRHDRHKSSSKSSSRSHSHSSSSKHGSSSKTSSERSKSSKSSHRSLHDKSKSHSSRSDSKSSLSKSGGESKQSSTTTKSSKSSSKTADNEHDDNGTKRKSKSRDAPVDITSINIDNVSPSSVFDTDSEEDDVMAQCRMIFEEFKEVSSNNGKTDEMVVSVLLNSPTDCLRVTVG